MKMYFDPTERHGVVNKTKMLIDEYTSNNGRRPEIILMDVFSFESITRENAFAATTAIMESKFEDITVQLISCTTEFIVCQANNYRDIKLDAIRDYEKHMKNIQMLTELGPEHIRRTLEIPTHQQQLEMERADLGKKGE